MNRIRCGCSFLTALFTLAALGCSGGKSANSGASGSGAPAGSGTGTVQLLLAASTPPNAVQSLVVTFDRVTVYPAGGGAMPVVEQGPVNLALNTASVDVANLGGGTALLASGIAVNGDYDRVEVSISGARITYSGSGDKGGGANIAMRVSSGVVDVPAAFTVSSGGTVRVVLSFNTGGSVQLGNGTPTLHPSLRLSSVQ